MEETPSPWDMGTERLLNFSEHKEVTIEEMQREIKSLKELYASVALETHNMQEKIDHLENGIERVSNGNDLIHMEIEKERSWYDFWRNNRIIIGGLALASSVVVAVPLVASVILRKNNDIKE